MLWHRIKVQSKNNANDALTTISTLQNASFFNIHTLQLNFGDSGHSITKWNVIMIICESYLSHYLQFSDTMLCHLHFLSNEQLEKGSMTHTAGFTYLSASEIAIG
jgi:hypothetical protein